MTVHSVINMQQICEEKQTLYIFILMAQFHNAPSKFADVTWERQALAFGIHNLAQNNSKRNEPAHEIMALFVIRKLILQTRMRSHPVGLDV